jgi:hypothetical protein
MADCNTQAKNFLELEFDGRADLNELVTEIFAMRDGGRELAS